MTTNGYKRFCFSALTLSSVIVAMDVLFGVTFKPFFEIQERGKYFTTTYAITRTKDQILILGNSHAAQHFNANRMMDSLKMTVFNLGNQHQTLLYHYPVLESILLHHQPKLVILNLDPNELDFKRDDYERLSILLPYFGRNRFLDSAIKLGKPFESYKATSNFYRFNSTIGYVILNSVGNSYEKSIYSKGFDPQYGCLCKSDLTTVGYSQDDKAAPLDNTKIKFLNQIILSLQKANIELLVTIAPVFNGKLKSRVGYDKLISILRQHNITYRDYYFDMRFSDNCKLFHDQNHLNLTGANIFTDIIIKEIQQESRLARLVSPPVSEAIDVGGNIEFFNDKTVHDPQ